MSEIDQQFVEYVVKSLVGKPDAVQIKRTIDEKGVLLELTVDPEDLGRVIGKRGATAQSLRTLLRALGTKNEARYNLKIVDNGDPEHRRGPAADSAPKEDSSSKSDDQSTDQSTQQPSDNEPEASEPEKVAVAPEEDTEEDTEESQTSDRLRQAREELSDLDDLDI